MKYLIVGGTFDEQGGKQSGIIDKIYKNINIQNDGLKTLYNGGYVADIEEILLKSKLYDVVFWMPNIPNNYEKIRNVKEVAPYTLLVSSKRNDGDKYSFQELINRALGMKANLTIEFKKVEDNLFHLMLFDPLGTLWYEGYDLEECMEKTINRIQFLKSITRQSTIKDDSDLFMKWYLEQIKEKNYKVMDQDEKINFSEDFMKLVKEYAKVFHEIMLPEKGVNRFLGNASLRLQNFRCLKGFPSYRSGKYILVSQRNINKEYISIENFVPTYLKDEKIYYCGDKKPSVDTPIQLRLYEKLPKINFMIHAHCYIKNAPFTEISVPCGAIEEVEEIMKVINKTDPNREKNVYYINLIGHGSIAMSNNVQGLRNILYISRDLPEKIY